MKLFSTIAFFIFAGMAVNGQQTKDIQPEIKGVILFQNRAQVSRESVVQVSTGQSVLRISGLSPFIDPSSIQVKGEGDFTIVSVNSQTNYLQNPDEDPKVDELRKKIESLTANIEDERTAMGVLQEKEAFLTANRVITGNGQNITAEQYKSMTDLYVAGIESARTGILKRNRNIKLLEAEKQKLENQLNGLVNKSKLPSFEVLVTVSASRQVNARLSLSYLVANAGWSPSYDIRVDQTGDPAGIYYKANAWQNTGIDWKNVKMSFSNASPTVSGNVPVLFPWYINFYQSPSNGIRIRGSASQPVVAKSARAAEEVADLSEYESVPSNALEVQVSMNATSFSFDLEMPQTIISDGKMNLVELQRLTAGASYRYRCVPKLRQEAFLTADIPDWESLNLLDGDANIYFGNTFTGKTFISTSQLSDTLNVSLGVDNGVTVKREKRKEFTTTRLIGANRIETRSFIISVRNTRTQKIKISVYDQIPVSQNNNIEVEATELSGGVINETTGEVKWDTEIDPQQSKDFILTYTVKYPKNMKVILE